MAIDAHAAERHPDAFWDAFVRMCRRLNQIPENLAAVLWSESNFDPHAQNFSNGADKPAVAKGLNQLIHSTAKKPFIGLTEDEWAVFQDWSAHKQLVYVERYFKGAPPNASKGALYRRNFGGYNNPDGSLYASKAAQADWIASHPGDTFKDPDYQQAALDQNAGLSSDGHRTIRQSDLERFVGNLPPAWVRDKLAAASARVDAGTDDKGDGGGEGGAPGPVTGEEHGLDFLTNLAIKGGILGILLGIGGIYFRSRR